MARGLQDTKDRCELDLPMSTHFGLLSWVTVSYYHLSSVDAQCTDDLGAKELKVIIFALKTTDCHF